MPGGRDQHKGVYPDRHDAGLCAAAALRSEHPTAAMEADPAFSPKEKGQGRGLKGRAGSRKGQKKKSGEKIKL